MTRTNNDELIRIALQIAVKDAEACELRQRARACSDQMTGRNLEKDAWSLDGDICQLCTELRIACLPVAA